MQRRGFLGAILAAAVAPAVIRNAMPVKPLGEGVLLGFDLGVNEQTGIAIMERYRVEVADVQDLQPRLEPFGEWEYQPDAAPLYRGALGRYDGVRIVRPPPGFIGANDPRAVKKWAKALQEHAQRRPTLLDRLDGVVIVEASMYDRLRSR